MADNAVSIDKLADNAVGSGQVADNSLTALDLAINSVGSREVIDDFLTASDLADNSVTTAEIADNAVGSSEITDGTVTANDLADDYVNTNGDTMTGDLNVGGDINTNGVLRMDGTTVLKIDNSGKDNTFLGDSAGLSNTTGFRNTFPGNFAGTSNTTGHSNVFIGYQAGYNETGSNTLYIDNSDTSTPLIYGDFYNNSLRINGELTVTDLSTTNSYYYVKYDFITCRFFDAISSERYKEEIQDLEDDFYKILEVRPRVFVDKTSRQREIGYIAEEFDDLGLANLVIYNDEGLPNGLKYDQIPLYLVEIIKDQKAELEEQKTRIEEQQAQTEQQQKTIVILSERRTRLEQQRR